jgi:hypothetical protein
MKTPTTLHEIEIVFYTHHDDKDPDTSILAELRSDAGLLAHFFLPQDSGVGFGDDPPSTHRAPMIINGQVSTEDVAAAKHPAMTIYIEPKGHDTWRFDWHVDYIWEGHGPLSESSATVTDVRLWQSHKSETWAINIQPKAFAERDRRRAGRGKRKRHSQPR